MTPKERAAITALREALAEPDWEAIGREQLRRYKEKFGDFEQAEQEPVGIIMGGELVVLVDEYKTGAWPIYASPVKQAEQEPVKVTGAMVYAFHHALTDAALGAGEFDEIKLGLEAAFVNITTPTEPVKQEPVCIDWDGKTDEPIMGYTAPVRTKDLTDEELFSIANKVGFDGDLMKMNHASSMPSIAEQYARAVIAAYREKNR